MDHDRYCQHDRQRTGGNAETGLYYYRARYYDPASGRFVSEDPIGFEGGMNLYEYVGDNPANLRDPFGLQAVRKPVTSPEPVPPRGPTPVPDHEPGNKGPLAFCVANPEICLAILYALSPGGSGNWANSQEAQFENQAQQQSRKIPEPCKPKRGCTCTCRADADDTMPGNITPGRPTFAFGTATAGNCAEASKEAKRIATRSLGMKPKHIPCVCAGR